MKTPALLLSLLPILPLLASPFTARADPIQTQPASTGEVEVDVIKAAVKEGILTIQLSYRNKGSAEVTLAWYLDGVYYIDEKDKKKYHVLKDSKAYWIAAPVAGDRIDYVKIAPGAKSIIWFKFPAPAPGTAKINLVVPDVLPFEDLPVSQ